MAMLSPFITSVYKQLSTTLTKLSPQGPNQLLVNEHYSHDSNIKHSHKHIKKRKKKKHARSDKNTQIKHKK